MSKHTISLVLIAFLAGNILQSAMMLANTSKKLTPPYVSYRTFLNFLEVLQQYSMPARIDRSFWGERYSGTTGTQLMAALRFLDLIDSSSFPTLKLRQLVVSRDAQRAEILKNITLEAYSFIYGRIDPQTATYAQMEEAFRDDYQIASDVARKCIKFFIGISGGGGMNISPFISRKNKVPRPVTTSKKNTKTPTKKIGMEVPNSELNEVKQIPNGIGVDKILLDKFPELDPAWTDEIKVKWFEAFDELLRRTGSSS